MFSLDYNLFDKLHVHSSLNVILVNLQSLEWESEHWQAYMIDNVLFQHSSQSYCLLMT